MSQIKTNPTSTKSTQTPMVPPMNPRRPHAPRGWETESANLERCIAQHHQN